MPNEVDIDERPDVIEEIYVKIEVQNLCPFITLKELFGTLTLYAGMGTINETWGEMMEIESYKKTCKNKYIYKLPLKNIYAYACGYSRLFFRYTPPVYIHDCSKFGCKDACHEVIDKISPRISKDSIGLIKKFSSYSNTVTGIKIYLKCLLLKRCIRDAFFNTVNNVVVSRMVEVASNGNCENEEPHKLGEIAFLYYINDKNKMVKPTNLKVTSLFGMSDDIPDDMKEAIWNDTSDYKAEKPFEIVHDFGIKIIEDVNEEEKKTMRCIKYYNAVLMIRGGLLGIMLNKSEIGK